MSIADSFGALIAALAVSNAALFFLFTRERRRRLLIAKRAKELVFSPLGELPARRAAMISALASAGKGAS